MKQFLTIALLLINTALYSQYAIITTVVGNGYGSDTGDGGAATAAGICPSGVSPIDEHGNYYIAERLCHTIRKISGSGVITHFAGTGSYGYSGDGGMASSAQLDNPYCMTLDDSGNLYIGEVDGSRVRKIDKNTGIIMTFAGNGSYWDSGDGGAATAAAIGYIQGLCFDRRRNLYISSYNKIRKVDASTGIISTFAGSTSSSGGFSGDGGPATAAVLNGPMGICFDSGGNLYIADDGNFRIRKVNAATNIISTIAGSGSSYYNGEGLPATAAGISPIYISIDYMCDIVFADEGNHRIRKITTTNQVFTVGGTGVPGFSGDGGRADSAKLYFPEALVVDDCRNIFFADNNNYRIRKISVETNNAPSISIAAATGNNLCYGMPVTFAAHTTLAGSAPVYQWKVNGVNVGTSAPAYTYTPSNGDSVQCLLTSSLYCVVNPMDTSNTIHMSVGSYSAPTISITGDTVKGVGATVNLTASITGTSGSYNLHWKNRGVEFAVTTIPTVSYIKSIGTDTIIAELASTGRTCYDSVVSNRHEVSDHNLDVGSLQSAVCSLRVHPNPARNTLFIEVNTSLQSIVVTNILGQKLLEQECREQKIAIDISGLKAGLYFVKINGIYSERFIKQ